MTTHATNDPMDEGWRVVAQDDLRPAPEPTWCSGAGWLAWQNGARHVGVHCHHLLCPVDEARLAAHVALMAERFESCDVLLDVASAQLAAPAALPVVERLVQRMTRAYGARVRRLVLVVDALAPWWRGVLMASAPSFAWHIVERRGDAWAWLGQPGWAWEVDRLLSREAGSTLLPLIEAAVMSRPAADLAAISRVVGMSSRTLQRSLARLGMPFNEVRDRVRFTLALRYLAEPASKLDWVAREVGFASAAYFCSWFKRRTGTTPGSRRKDRGDQALGEGDALDGEPVGSGPTLQLRAAPASGRGMQGEPLPVEQRGGRLQAIGA